MFEEMSGKTIPHFTKEVSSPKCKILTKSSLGLLLVRKETHGDKQPSPLESTFPCTPGPTAGLPCNSPGWDHFPLAARRPQR